jgi:N-acetylglucosaminyl-diphospho-decaprenol L-rhamnosyltransferase
VTPALPYTAVVVLHDSADELRALLASLTRAARPPAQLVVVDSGSASDTGAALARASGAQVVRLPGNPGFGAANNAGVALAVHEVTVLVNPDVTFHDDALDALARHARDRDALHVPRLLNADGTVQRSAHPVPGTPRALLPAVVHPRVLPRRAREAADPWRATAPREVGWAIAACVAARTSTLCRLGPFDPAAFLFYEDMELCLRARATGHPTVLHPDIVMTHSGGHSTGPALGPAHALQAARRHAVVADVMGPRATAWDDAAQALTFATRAAGRRLLRRDASRERAQLEALRAARRGDATG